MLPFQRPWKTIVWVLVCLILLLIFVQQTWDCSAWGEFHVEQSVMSQWGERWEEALARADAQRQEAFAEDDPQGREIWQRYRAGGNVTQVSDPKQYRRANVSQDRMRSIAEKTTEYRVSERETLSRTRKKSNAGFRPCDLSRKRQRNSGFRLPLDVSRRNETQVSDPEIYRARENLTQVSDRQMHRNRGKYNSGLGPWDVSREEHYAKRTAGFGSQDARKDDASRNG